MVHTIPPNAPNNWVYGNYILLQISRQFQLYTVTELVLFCHLKKGSIPNSLKQTGAKVYAGDIIGRAGNSGQAAGPHTHIECTDSLAH